MADAFTEIVNAQERARKAEAKIESLQEELEISNRKVKNYETQLQGIARNIMNQFPNIF
jgi:predicted  nucleic acid-binding Zn-ribbon protein